MQTSNKEISEKFDDFISVTNKCIEAIYKFNTFYEKFAALVIVLGFKPNGTIGTLCKINKDTIMSYREDKSTPDERYLMIIIDVFYSFNLLNINLNTIK